MKLQWVCVVLIFLIVNGCELETVIQPPDKSKTYPGSDLVINEVYTIAPDRHYSYSWIELYNPTKENKEFVSSRTIGGDTLEYSYISINMRMERRVLAGEDYIVKVDTGYDAITAFQTPPVEIQGTVVFTPPAFSSSENIFGSGEFVNLTNNKDFFDEHWRTPPRDPRTANVGFVLVRDTTLGIFGFQPALWYPLPQNEVVLERITIQGISIPIPPELQGVLPSGSRIIFIISKTVKRLDVVRFGNYRVTPDVEPDNTPLGDIAEGLSVARYAEYFKTGNTSDAFYVSPDPIPGWFNQRKHP